MLLPCQLFVRQILAVCYGKGFRLIWPVDTTKPKVIGLDSKRTKNEQSND